LPAPAAKMAAHSARAPPRQELPDARRPSGAYRSRARAGRDVAAAARRAARWQPRALGLLSSAALNRLRRADSGGRNRRRDSAAGAAWRRLRKRVHGTPRRGRRRTRQPGSAAGSATALFEHKSAVRLLPGTCVRRTGQVRQNRPAPAGREPRVRYRAPGPELREQARAVHRRLDASPRSTRWRWPRHAELPGRDVHRGAPRPPRGLHAVRRSSLVSRVAIPGTEARPAGAHRLRLRLSWLGRSVVA
jgi:hypothetical protein